MGVQDLAGAVPGEVVGAAGREPGAVPGRGDQRAAGLVGERAVEVGVGQRLHAARDHHVPQPGVGGQGARPLQFRLAAADRQVVEGDREQPLPRARAVTEHGAGAAGQAGGEQGQGAGAGAAGQVGADAGHRHPVGAAVGGPHAGHRAGVRPGAGHVPGSRQPGADRLHQRLAQRVHGAVRVGGGRGHGERGDRLVPGDLTRSGAQDQGVSWRDAPHPFVGGRVLHRGRDLRRGEQGGQVPEVEVGADQVGERQRRGGVGGAAPPRGVEDGAGAGQVAADRGAPVDLDHDGVAAGPGGEVAQRAAAGREEAGQQLVVGGPAQPHHRYPGAGVGDQDAGLVGPPVAHRPQRVDAAPQQLRAHRLGDVLPELVAAAVGFAVGAEEVGAWRPMARGGAAPSHQPPHRRLHRLWTISARANLCTMLPRRECHGGMPTRPPCRPREGPVKWRSTGAT